MDGARHGKPLNIDGEGIVTVAGSLEVGAVRCEIHCNHYRKGRWQMADITASRPRCAEAV